MKNDLAAYPTGEELAQIAGMSTARYQLAFRKYYGTTPYEYLKELRLNQALILLKNSDYGIATIAAKVGYHNSGHFAKLFKKVYGLGPREYRNLHGIRVVIQHAALILSKLDETDTLELHTMDNAIILLKKDMTLVETRDVLQGMVRLARSMTLDALCNSDAEDKTPLVDESFDDEYEDTITIPVPLEAFVDAGLLDKDLRIQVIDGAVVITEDTDDD